MKTQGKPKDEIFSFHLARLPLARLPRFLAAQNEKVGVDGFKHAERLFTMNLGEPILSVSRYDFRAIAFFAWWRDESSLETYLDQPNHEFLRLGWHVRMKLYRRWGEVTELKEAFVDPSLAVPDEPVVAVTLARLNLLSTRRFIQWGKPVERQVRDHRGQTLALAAMRPLSTFSTFSIWRTEADMLDMVHGKNPRSDGEEHKLAMRERIRKDFHHEFTTLRFRPLSEFGSRPNSPRML